MPPTIGGMRLPKERGQSGTARPASLLVTKPPAISRKKVAPAVRRAKVLSPRL
jgi:hypothetical protein